ncbi:hypothetical protein GALMADRAFT_60317 [Galerina marginata CBS 339.88]|uniref:Uncharacterized protein n=1 Tax=Galerina marginata (strain CBS 339.88) TaxID=685588 RepID=A0A067TH10_GALM3|nr:hypothetical protein GALMADRAFT_60317 [Galerina marginata CBS 339.88]
MSIPRSLSLVVKPCNIFHVRGAGTSNARRFHASTPTYDLVAPPDPVSHMRRIIYDDPLSQPPAPYLQHPYSLSEFKTETGTGTRSGNHDLQFRLLRQQLDSLHQNFWLDSNTRFYSARDAVLSSLPATASPRDKEEALSAFFRQWVMQEKEWTEGYTTEWRTRNLQLIILSTRVEYHRLKARLSNFVS